MANSSLNINQSNKVYLIDPINPGIVIIFNMKLFRNDSNSTRNGSEKDVERLSNLFRDLDYQVETKLELNSNDMRRCLKEYSNKDYSQVSCFIMFIMSHGEKGTILASDNSSIYLTEFIDPFKTNRSLINKPKLFFVQACRGDQEMLNIESDSTSTNYDRFETDANRVPIEVDFLYSYSTVKGFFSYRNPESGSWFIQTLCDVIEKEKNEHILDILTQVNNLISKKEKAMSTFETTLTKKFYFIQNINQQSENKLLFNNNNKSYGKLDFDNGYYEGKIINNKMHGKGIYYYASGSKYDGDFKDDKMHGKGIYYYASGNKYDGDWKDDKKQGKGIYYYATRDKYDGEFKDDKKQGKGIYYYATGDKYDGDWKDHKMHGKGIYYFANGDKYDGDCKDDKKHGKGIYYFNVPPWKGDKYDGDWKDGKKHGSAYYYTNGKRFEQFWDNGNQIK